jgi:membrane associated rhomboid family serine protease
MNTRNIMGGRTSFLPPFITFLVITNVIIFLVQGILENMTFAGQSIQDQYLEFFALQPLGGGLFMPWQVVSYQFLHGGFFHLFFNMFALWMFGSELENIWGKHRFAVFYLLSGIVAALAQLFVAPLFGSAASTIGASGSIMGVLMAFAMSFPRREILMFPFFFPIQARFFVLIYASFDLIRGLSDPGSTTAHFAHLGGALGGFLLMKFGQPLLDRLVRMLGGNKEPYGVYRLPQDEAEDGDLQLIVSRRPDPPSVVRPSTPTRYRLNDEVITEEMIDDILDRMNLYGYNRLSARDKAILQAISNQIDP